MAAKPKPPQKDKHSKLDLELFLIALVERNINTPYSLHVNVGLSPGATIPVLKKLKQAGYVRRGKSGPRRRAEYEVTGKGTHYLTQAWQPLLDAPPPPDMESVFRIVGLAMMSGADLRDISAFLMKAAGQKADDAMERQADAARLESLNVASWETDFYAGLRARYAGLRLSADSSFLRGLATALLKGGD